MRSSYGAQNNEMRRHPLWALVLAGSLSVTPALAVDHNNVDAHRPLTFDDAESLAFRERSFEVGLGLGWPEGAPLGVSLAAEYLYGFALNSHISLGFEPSIGGRAGEESTSFNVGDVSLGVFHNFNREYNGTPALSLRGDLSFPTGRDSEGVGYRLRGIMSKQAGQYGRLHLNVDLSGNPDPPPGERTFHPGVTLGYTKPLGYPTTFTTTGLAELSVQAGSESGTGPVVSAGLGLRKQVGVRSVVDLGLRSDVAAFDDAPRDYLRLVAGYSYGF
jgi:hypothetical protein